MAILNKIPDNKGRFQFGYELNMAPNEIDRHCSECGKMVSPDWGLFYCSIQKNFVCANCQRTKHFGNRMSIKTGEHTLFRIISIKEQDEQENNTEEIA